MRPNKSYSELIQYQTFEDRVAYLMLHGAVGRETFGIDRYINQQFYASREWKSTRDAVIVRDNACDLGVPGNEIFRGLLIHHINPMSADDIYHARDWICDPEYLITTTHRTHNAIHYCDLSQLAPRPVVERTPGDTKLW